MPTDHKAVVAYYIKWSEEDQEYVGTCDAFPSLSHLDKTSTGALLGIIDLVKFAKEEVFWEREKEKADDLG